MLLPAVVCMNLALVFYSWAVFGARRRGLRRGHLPVFACGLACDYLGTRLMLLYGLAHGIVPTWHYLTGIASLCAMAFHFLLALLAAAPREGGPAKQLFHRVSLGIYCCWLIAFFSGAAAGMS